MTVQTPYQLAHRILLTVATGCLLVGTCPGQAATESAPASKEATKEAPKTKPAMVPSPPKEGKPAPAQSPSKEAKPAAPAAPQKETKPTAAATQPAAAGEPAENTETPPAPADPDDEAAAEHLDAEAAAVARPVTPDPIQIYGWREHIAIKGVEEKLQAKLDTGALTSSIHAEEKELFERDGKKWVRFIVTDPSLKKPTRTRIEAPLVRIARIKEPGAESVAREVVQLSFQLGERKLRGDFTLNNRSNMLAPVLIGRNMIKVLGWVDPGRTYLADQKIFR